MTLRREQLVSKQVSGKPWDTLQDLLSVLLTSNPSFKMETNLTSTEPASVNVPDMQSPTIVVTNAN